MFCSKCGNQYEGQPAFCDRCGNALHGIAPRSISGLQFKSLHSMSRILVVALSLVIAFNVILAGISIHRIDLANRMLSGGFFSDGELDISNSVSGLVEMLYLIPFTLASVVFLIWIHRASRNLKPLGSSDQSYSPGWAVGWFFIPFANLVMPFLVARDIWKASAPEIVAGDGWHKAGVSLVVPAWWLFTVLDILINIPYILTVLIHDTANRLLAESWVLLVSAVIQIFAAVSFLLLVQGITKRQDDRNRFRLSMDATPVESGT